MEHLLKVDGFVPNNPSSALLSSDKGGPNRFEFCLDTGN